MSVDQDDQEEVIRSFLHETEVVIRRDPGGHSWSYPPLVEPVIDQSWDAAR